MVDRVIQNSLKTNSIVSDSQHEIKKDSDDAIMQQLEQQFQNLPQSLSENVNRGKFDETMDIVNEIREESGMPQVSENINRRLFELLARIAQTVETHISDKKTENFKKKQKIEKETISEITSLTHWQGGAYGASAFAAPAVMVFGFFLPSDATNALNAFAQATGTIAQGFDKWTDGTKTKANYDMNFFVQNFSSEKQSQEGLKNLPMELQQKLSKLADSVISMYREIGQR